MSISEELDIITFTLKGRAKVLIRSRCPVHSIINLLY